jgi:hypothetical protein
MRQRGFARPFHVVGLTRLREILFQEWADQKRNEASQHKPQ